MSNSNDDWSLSQKIFAGTGATLVLGLFCSWIWYMSCVGFIDNYELGFTYNKYSGQIEKVSHTGWVVLNPFCANLHKIDLRPYQLTMNANSRVLNAKLVRFNPDGLNTFVEWHGRDAGDQHANLLEILKSYAFDPKNGKDCPFLIVVSESASEQTVPTPPTVPTGTK